MYNHHKNPNGDPNNIYVNGTSVYGNTANYQPVPMPQGSGFNWAANLGQTPGVQGAAAQQTQQDVQNASFNTPNVNATRGGTGNPRSGHGQNQHGAGSTPEPIPPPSDLIHGSPEWYGGLNDYGVQQALGSPQGFWGLYGEDQQGWNPSGNASAFMASRYDPYTLTAALNPQANGIWDNERLMAGMTGIGNQLSGDRANFFDTTQIMSGVLNAIASNDDQALMQANPQLAMLINSQKGNPAGQVNTILQFFDQILPSMMPKDMADALLAQMQSVGNQWALGLARGELKNLDAANFAQYLLQSFGPALGLG